MKQYNTRNLTPFYTKIKVFSFLLTFLFSSCLTAQNNAYQWAVSYGGSSVDAGYSLGTDAMGNVYATGYFAGTVDFDPGPGTTNLGTTNGSDAFITKLDPLGNLVWAKNFTGSNNVKGLVIRIDGNQNVYTMGEFDVTVDFDPGVGISNISSFNNSKDIYISKLDAAGDFVWAKQLGGAATDAASDLFVDQAGNVYVTGSFNAPIDFDPGAGTAIVTPSGGSNIFIVKLDASGDFVWVKNFGGTDDAEFPYVSVDPIGNICLTGRFKGTVDFDPGAGISNLTANGTNFDLFVLKLDASGNFVWAESFGNTGLDIGNSIVNDAVGNIYLTGAFGGTVDFDAGPGTINLSSGASYNAFVLKLNESGATLWAKMLGGSSQIIGRSVRLDASGNVYSFGDYSGTSDFDPGAGVSNLGTNGGGDVYISKLDPAGDFVWAKNLGGSNLDRVYGGAVDVFGNVLATGDYFGTADFDPGAGVSNFTPNGVSDIYIVKLGCNPSSGTVTVTACNNYFFNGVNYTSNNNTATDTLTNASGCDSIVTLDLTILNATAFTDIQTACDTFIWINGFTYTASNDTSIAYLTNAAGCDSIVTLNLTFITLELSTTLVGNTITSNATGATYQWIDCTNGNSPIVGETAASYTATAIGDYAVVVSEGNCSDTSDCVAITSIGVGIKDAILSRDIFRLYPNPSKSLLTIESQEDIIALSISDILGKTVLSLQSPRETIDVSDLTKGIYLLQIQVKDGFATKKFIKD